MTGSVRRWALHWPAAAVLVIGLLLAAAVLLDARSRTDLGDARDAGRSAASALLPVSQAILDQRDQSALQADSRTRSVAADDPSGPSPDVAELARDTGKPALDDLHGGVIVTARYDPPDPTTVAARRSSLVGYSLTPLDLSSAFAALDAHDGWVAVYGPDRQVATSAPGSSSAHAVRYQVPMSSTFAPGWRLVAVVPRSPLPAGAWAVAALCLLLTFAAAAVTVRRSTRGRNQGAQARRLSDAESTLAELATVTQRSLDLADVLPASFAVLESALGLDGVALLGATTRPTFSWGNVPDRSEPVSPSVAPVPAGRCVDLPLARAGRSLGLLRVRAGRDLDELDLRTLTSAAATLSSAVANADAFAHQQAMITRMQELDDLKTVFVATASHELRTPVAAVIGYANLLVENWDDLDSPSGLLYAQRVDNNARRLAALVENLLDFSRLERGGFQSAANELLDLGREVEAVMETQSNVMPDQVLDVEVQPRLMVLGSRLAIDRVVTNLVGNASKYEPAGTTIRIRVTGGDGSAHLIVDDEGPGVPDKEREQIFSRFFRGKGDAVIRTRGAGLGLSIVTEFAASMDGVISLSTAPSGGSRFEVTYPLHQPETVEPVVLARRQ